MRFSRRWSAISLAFSKRSGLDQHHLKLGGGVDIDHLVAPALVLHGKDGAGAVLGLGGLPLQAVAAGAVHALAAGDGLEVVKLLLFLFVLIGAGQALEFI